MGIEESDVDPETFLEDVEMRVGTVTDAAPFPEARKDLYRLTVSFGSETRQSAAGLTENYTAGHGRVDEVLEDRTRYGRLPAERATAARLL